MITPPYTLHTTTDANGAEHPDETLWTPTDKTATEEGFHRHGDLLVVGVGTGDMDIEPPDTFLVLGHGHTWSAMYGAATAYMRHVYDWPDLLGPSHEQRDIPLIDPSRTQRPWTQHAVFPMHLHRDRPCVCEREGWRVEFVPGDEPGAVPVTTMIRPGADPQEASA